MKTNTLLMGPVGTGKTHSLKTLLKLGLEVFVLSMEPGIEHILGDTPPDQLHWQKVFPAVIDWNVARQSALKINTMTIEQIQKSTAQKGNFRQLLDVIDACNDFRCERTGKAFGSIDTWDDNRVFVMDGLSGLSKMAMDLVAGDKPVKTQPEWGVAMDTVERTVNLCANSTKCSFVLLAHVDREVNEVTGGTFITVSTLGRKLAPRLLQTFDEVIVAQRQGKKFSWTTLDASYDLKCRRLDFGEYAPDFACIWEATP